MAEIDWASWGKTKPFNIEALSLFTGIDVDPYTALVACTLCHQFKFSPHGYQNVGNALGTLQIPQGHPVLGLGYTPRHIVNLLLKADEGSTFLALCGALCEYYPVETVVSVFISLAEKSKLPREMWPARSQWSKLIESCAGVLSTSSFVLSIALVSRVYLASFSTDAGQIASGLLALNARQADMIPGDATFLTAVGEWLFGVKTIIETNRSRGGGAEGLIQPIVKARHAEPMNVATVGRVKWESVFRDCFGQAWQDLNKESMAAIIAAASAMTHNALLKSGRDPRTFFLRHEVDVPDLAGFGMNETIIAWFEELRRLAPGIRRTYKAHHTADDLQNEFDKRLQSLESDCSCAVCGSGYSQICLVSLAESIIALGLYVARMVVVPGLYMKVDGVQQFYRGVHKERLERQQNHVGYSEWFIKGLSEDLPTPFKMVEIACLLFTGKEPGHLLQNQLSIASGGLYILITYLKFNPNDAPEARPAASVQVERGGFSYYGRFLQKNFWDPGPANISIEEGFENIHSRPREVQQIVKLLDHATLISQIGRNPDEEKKAEEQGWDLQPLKPNS